MYRKCLILGATKSNRPNLKVGDLLFASIKFASKHLEPEVCCAY